LKFPEKAQTCPDQESRGLRPLFERENLMPERITRPEFPRPPQTQAEASGRAAEHAIYTLKNALAEEHFLRTGHEANRRVKCPTCSLIVAGTTSDPRQSA
jgi:hypothetical protein